MSELSMSYVRKRSLSRQFSTVLTSCESFSRSPSIFGNCRPIYTYGTDRQTDRLADRRTATLNVPL